MRNCKDEFLGEVKGKNVSCAAILLRGIYKPGDMEEFCSMIDFNHELKPGYSKKDMEDFLFIIDFDYDAGYGRQNLFGYIWYTDGTWSEREEYDGLECWSYKKCPVFGEGVVVSVALTN